MAELMKNGSERQSSESSAAVEGIDVSSLHPAWRALVSYCAELGYGQIEQLKIQDGLPVIAEVTQKKIKFLRQ